MNGKRLLIVLTLSVAMLFTLYLPTFATESYSSDSEIWTDFTKAKIKVEETNDVKRYIFTISDVNINNEHSYYYYIGDGTVTPDFSSNSMHQLNYDSSKKVFYSGNEIAEYLELGKEQYIYVFEYYINSNSELKNKLVMEKTKLNKPEQKKYAEVFYDIYAEKTNYNSNNEFQILFNTPWGDNTVRKIHIRIGKITDNNLLKDIYEKKSNCFDKLLNYGKTGTAFYDKEINSNTDSNYFAGGIKISEKDNMFDINNITKNGYYFLYAVLEDENGKYVKTEGVTLAKGSKNSADDNNYALFFYGSNNFTWEKFNFASDDPTIAPFRIPDTGASTIIITYIFIFLVLSIYSFILYKNEK